MADYASTLHSVREKLPDLSARVLLLMDCFEDDSLLHLSSPPTVRDLKQAVEISLGTLKTHLDGDSPVLHPDVSEEELQTLDQYISCRQHFILGLTVQADRGGETIQELMEASPLYQEATIRFLQHTGRDVLTARLNDGWFLSTADSSASATLDWEVASTTKQSRQALFTANALLSL
jgi:hypothetical protein